MAIDSRSMLSHQKHPRGNQLIREYMLRDYPEPEDFASFLYVSQVLQAEGGRIGLEQPVTCHRDLPEPGRRREAGAAP